MRITHDDILALEEIADPTKGYYAGHQQAARKALELIVLARSYANAQHALHARAQLELERIEDLEYELKKVFS